MVAAFLLSALISGLLRLLAAPPAPDADRGSFSGGRPAPESGRLRLRLEGRDAGLAALAFLVAGPALWMGLRASEGRSGTVVPVVIATLILVVLTVHLTRRIKP